MYMYLTHSALEHIKMRSDTISLDYKKSELYMYQKKEKKFMQKFSPYLSLTVKCCDGS